MEIVSISFGVKTKLLIQNVTLMQNNFEFLNSMTSCIIQLSSVQFIDFFFDMNFLQQMCTAHS